MLDPPVINQSMTHLVFNYYHHILKPLVCLVILPSSTQLALPAKSPEDTQPLGIGAVGASSNGTCNWL